MMTLRRIQRLIRTGDDDALLDAVLSNGRPLPIEARLRLGEPDSIGAAATAFGLQRAVELSACADPVSLEGLDRLLAHQQKDGGFGNAATTAAAVRALDALVRAPGLQAAECGQASDAMDRAVHALHCDLARSISGWRRSNDADLDHAMVLWQLADLPRCRDALLLEALERELTQRALADAPRRVLALAGTLAPARRAA